MTRPPASRDAALEPYRKPAPEHRGASGGTMTKALVMLGLVAAILPGRTRGDEISVDFATGVFDRLIFRPDTGFGYGRWESRGQGLRATIPQGVTGRSAMHFDGLLQLEGDFEVTTDFVINRLARPRGEGRQFSRCAIASRSAWAARALRQWSIGPMGPRASFSARSASRPKAYSPRPLTPRERIRGRIGIRRFGGRIAFVHADAGRALTEFGSMEFGTGSVSGLGIYINPVGTTDAIDVRFNRLDIRADRLVRLEEPTSMSRPSRAVVDGRRGGRICSHHCAGLAKTIRRRRGAAAGATGQPGRRLQLDRTPGRHRHHRCPHRAPLARRSGGARLARRMQCRTTSAS